MVRFKCLPTLSGSRSAAARCVASPGLQRENTVDHNLKALKSEDKPCAVGPPSWQSNPFSVCAVHNRQLRSREPARHRCTMVDR